MAGPVRFRRPRAALIALGVAAAAFLAGTIVADQVVQQDARSTAEQLADGSTRLCRTDPLAAARAAIDCSAAEEVAREGTSGAGGRITLPGTAGDDGTDGADGRGIVATELVGDRLVLTFTDGGTADLGRVVGPAGEDGEPGDDGRDGEPGTDGADGDRGRGIVGTSVDSGRLLVEFTDGETTDVGRVVGTDGRGVVSVAAEDGRLIVTYTDGEIVDAGPLPAGERGPRGPAGPTCPEGFVAVVGSAEIGGTTYSRAAVCVDPDSASAPSPDPAPTSAPEAPTDPGESP